MVQQPGKTVFRAQPEAARAETPGQKAQPVKHDLIVEDRTHLTATGIRQVIAYDEYSATVQTDLGILMIGGKNLKVSELSCQSGELKVSGEIEYIQYEEKREKRGGLFGRLAR